MIKDMNQNVSVSHDRSVETPESKVRWFRSLSMEERMTVFCDYMDLALEAHPELMEKENAQPAQGRVLVVRAQ